MGGHPHPNGKVFSFGATRVDARYLAIWITTKTDEERDRLRQDLDLHHKLRDALLRVRYPIAVVPLVGFAFESQETTWAGALEGAERATHYLHLVAFPCEKCNGPVILGWIGTRNDDISKETEIKEAGAVCLSCGSRPETPTDSSQGRHFRPVEWEWTITRNQTP